MNNLYLLFAAGAIAAFTGCAKNQDFDNNEGTDSNGVEVIFHATTNSDSDTRADITIGDSKFTGEWIDADVMGVFATAPDNITPKCAPYTYSTSENGFKGTLHSTSHGNWEYVAFYPHAEATSINDVKIPFGSVREQNGNKFNSLYDVLLSEKVVCVNSDPGKNAEGTPVTFEMKRLTSILYLAMTTTELDAAKKVKLVRLTADKNISAEMLNIDCTDRSKTQLDAATSSKSIVLSYKDGAEPSVTDCKAFFNILPDTYATLTFDVQTTDGQVSTFTLNNKTFEAGKLYSSKDRQLSGWNKLALPTIEWVDHNMSGRYELNEALEVKVNMSVPASITRFDIDITSAALNGMGLSHLDLVNPDETTVQIADIAGLPFGDAVRYTTSQSFDMSAMMGLLMGLLNSDTENSNHDFVLTIGDAAGNTLTGTLQLQNIVKPTAIYNGDADLWKNTATMTVVPKNASDVKLEYRVKGATNWNTATLGSADASGNRTATIAATWNESTNTAGIKTYTVDSKTGIFAKNTYEYQLTADGSVTATGEFTPANNSGDIIPDGDMQNSNLPCYILQNASITSTTWGSGNNKVLAECWLCRQGSYTFNSLERKYAKLTSNEQNTIISGKILAAGNLFFGQFSQNGTGGDVRLGQQFNYTARPTALRFNYTAKVGTVNYEGKTPAKIAKGQPDKARIMVAVVDWSTRHTTSSKANVKFGGSATFDVSGSWEPETGSDAVPEGKIIGYGTLVIDEGTTDWTTHELKINYYDKTAKPQSDNYSLVISCGANMYGDFFNGCSSNELGVDNFEWVY